jgi:uncharacterized protein
MILKQTDHFFEKLNSYPALVFLTAAFSVRVVLSFTFMWVSVFVLHKPATSGILTYSSKAEEFFIIVLVAPIIETFLFQYLPFYFLKGKLPEIYIILLAALVFGCGHFYNWIYIFNTMFAGILYGCVYASKARVGKGFLYTWLLHMFYNCFAYFMNHF